MKLRYFLKVLKKFGYPNENLLSIAKFSNYNLDDFLPDLDRELGREKMIDFCKKALNKISGPEGFKVEFGNDEYVVVSLSHIDYDPEEVNTDLLVTMDITQSKILIKDEDGNEIYQSLPEIQSEMGIGEWGDYDEMMDWTKHEIYHFVHSRCGFGIFI